MPSELLWWDRDLYEHPEGYWVYPLGVPKCYPGKPPDRDMQAMAHWYRAVQLSQAGMLFWRKPDGEVYFVAHTTGQE